MTPFPPQFIRLLLATLVAAGFAGSSARAQDDADMEDRVELQRREDVQQPVVDKARRRLQAAYHSQFARWVNSEFRTLKGARHQLELLLALEVGKLTEQCHLTEVQQKKLELAGRGDIKHFLDRFDHIARTLEDKESSVDDLRAAMSEMQPLVNSTRQRIFSDDSLLAKTLASALDPQQTAAREKALAERNKELHERAIESAVKMLRTNLGLTEEQGARLEQLLRKETRPPRRFGTAPDVALVLFLASRISEDQMRSIFDDDQWRIIRRWMAVYFQGASAQGTLKRFGFVFDNEPAANGADRVEPAARSDDREGKRQDRKESPGGVP